jgi:hypothetical protein
MRGEVPTSTARACILLRSYLDQRISYYTTPDAQLLEQINAQTARLQQEMWSTISGPTSEQPTPVADVIAMGMC